MSAAAQAKAAQAKADEAKAAVRKVILDPIHMLSWKLLAVFHDPIHDFGLSTSRMCSIVNYINAVKKSIDDHDGESPPPEEVSPEEVSPEEVLQEEVPQEGGAKKLYAKKNEPNTVYIEERNIATVPEEYSTKAPMSEMYKFYGEIYGEYLKERNFFNENGGLNPSKIFTVKGRVRESGEPHVMLLQKYMKFFTTITKLIDLLKLLIVIQVINKHGQTTPPSPFSYNTVHKETVITAMWDLISTIAMNESESDREQEDFKVANDAQLKDINMVLFVMEAIFNTISSRNCLLQLDLLNSSIFNNLVRIFVSCYFYDEERFNKCFNVFLALNKELDVHDITREDIIKTVEDEQEERWRNMTESQEDSEYEEDSDYEEVRRGYNIEREFETTEPVPYQEEEVNLEGGGKRKRYNLHRPFILKGGAPGPRLERWMSRNDDNTVTQHNELASLFEEWNTKLKQKFDKKDIRKSFVTPLSSPVELSADDLYVEFMAFFTQVCKIQIVKDNFPILFNKMTKDIDYQIGQIANAVDRRTSNTRTNPKLTAVTKINDYMNELSSEIDTLEAEIDNEKKRSNAKHDKINAVGAVDTTITNRISRLIAKKGLEYAQVTLTIIKSKSAAGPRIDTCLKYIEFIIESDTSKQPRLKSPTEFQTIQNQELAIGLQTIFGNLGNDSFQILLHHIYFLGTAFLQHKNCLPDIDAKLIKYWRDFLGSNEGLKRRLMPQAEFMTLPSKVKGVGLRVINNGIPSEFKELFKKNVVCPTSSICDAMGSFGSCSGSVRNNEFFDMNLSIANTDGSDYYDVYSKVTGDLLEVVSNSFILYFPGVVSGTIDSMVIECRFGNVNLKVKPEMLSANNVFKLTLGVIEGIMKEQTQPMNVDALWGLLYTSDNFKKIITPTCQKATGDINQEHNSIVKYGGYIRPTEPSKLIKLDDMLSGGFAGDRPSGARMAQIAIFAEPTDLFTNFVVGYANENDSFLVKSKNFTYYPVKRGGSIRKTKFRKQKMMKTRKNKSYHYKIMSKRRKYNNKTKNRK